MLAKGAAGAAGSRDGVRHRGSNESRVFVGFKLLIIPDEIRRGKGGLWGLRKFWISAVWGEIMNFVNVDPKKFLRKKIC